MILSVMKQNGKKGGGLTRRGTALGILAAVVTASVILLVAWGPEWIKTTIDSLKPTVEKRYNIVLDWEDLHASWGSIRIDNLDVSIPDSGNRLFSAEEIEMHFDIFSILGGKPRLKHVIARKGLMKVGDSGSAQTAELSTLMKSFKSEKHGDSGGKEHSSLRPERISMLDCEIALTAAGGTTVSIGGIALNLNSAGHLSMITGPSSITTDGKCSPFSVKKIMVEGEIPSPRHLKIHLVEPSSSPCGSNAENSSRSRALLAISDLKKNLLATTSVQDGQQKKAAPSPLQVEIEVDRGSLEFSLPGNDSFHIGDIIGTLSQTGGAKAPLAGSLTGIIEDSGKTVTVNFKIDPSLSRARADLSLPAARGTWLGPVLGDVEWISGIDDTTAGLDLSLYWNEETGRLDLDLKIEISNLTIKSDFLSRTAVTLPGISATAKMWYRKEEPRLNISSLLLNIDSIPVSITGYVDSIKRSGDERTAFDLTWSLPDVQCNSLLHTVPKELLPHLGDTVLGGSIQATLRLSIDTDNPDSTVLSADLNNKCRVVDEGKIPKKGYFTGPFDHTVYDRNGNLIKITTGPGSDNWTPLAGISPYFIWALFVTEDAKFMRHEGITLPEVRRAIELNLKEGRWRHGASTITMQTVKNLFLGRQRTLSRKLEELVLTWWLESSFTKEEILELYVNIIEYGPEIYGIKNAAEHYFGRHPSDLDPLESVFLVKLLPDPVDRHVSYTKGRVSEKWLSVLHNVLRIMKKRGYLNEYELIDALERELVFYKEGDPLPEPRNLLWSSLQPLSGPSSDSYADAGIMDQE